MKNKGLRQEIKQRKYLKRLKRHGFHKEYLGSIENPRGEKYNFTGYKTSSNPCSCYLCSHQKYNRAKIKNQNKNID